MSWMLKTAFRDFLPKPQRALALDLGTDSIKLAELSPRNNEFEISILHKIPNPQGLFFPEPDYEVLAKTLKHMVEEYGLENRKIISTVWGNNVITRHVEMPQMPEKELKKAVRWEAKKNIPVSVSDMLVEFVSLENRSKENKQHLLVTAVSTELVYRFFEVFKKAGLRLAVLDLKPLALWRLFSAGNQFVESNREGSNSGETLVVADIGALSTHILFVAGKSVKYTRVLPVGGWGITEEIQQTLGIDAQAASVLKHQQGLIKAPEELLKELLLSIEFYHSKVGDSKVSKVILTGGESNLIGLPETLSNELKLPVESVRFNDSVGGIDPAFSIVLGLALRRLMDNV